MRTAVHACLIVTAFLFVGQVFLTLARPPRHRPVVPVAHVPAPGQGLVHSRANFSGCFESVVPRRQFVCRDGTIWTLAVDGWRVDRPTSVPRVPAG